MCSAQAVGDNQTHKKVICSSGNTDATAGCEVRESVTETQMPSSLISECVCSCESACECVCVLVWVCEATALAHAPYFPHSFKSPHCDGNVKHIRGRQTSVENILTDICNRLHFHSVIVTALFLLHLLLLLLEYIYTISPITFPSPTPSMSSLFTLKFLSYKI